MYIRYNEIEYNMPYYKEKKLLFLHIPKTGGQVIEKEIGKQCVQTLHSDYRNSLLDEPYNKKSLQHQYYTTLYKYQNRLDISFDNIKIFSVVRNPYDRIISDLFHWEIINKNYTSEQVCDVIKKYYLEKPYLDNHNEAQYKFLVDENGELIKNIKIFKTETLNESNDELNRFLGFDINIKQPNVNKNYSMYLNKESIFLINEYYKKDFELFNYKFKSAY